MKLTVYDHGNVSHANLLTRYLRKRSEFAGGDASLTVSLSVDAEIGAP